MYVCTRERAISEATLIKYILYMLRHVHRRIDIYEHALHATGNGLGLDYQLVLMK